MKTMSKLSVWSPRPNAIPIEILSESVSIYGLPVLEIVPIKLTQEQINIVLSTDALFYVSQYAVTSLLEQLSADAQDALKNKIHIAIGKQTAATLVKNAIEPAIIAKPPFNSESLLSDTTFQQLSFRRLALISGQTGRQLLEKTLQKQGKEVTRIISYKRNKSHISSQTMVEFISNYGINAVILSSCAIVDAVFAQLQIENITDFCKFPAFAFSQRIADYAKKLGFSQVIIIDSANRSALYDKILAWQDNQQIQINV